MSTKIGSRVIHASRDWRGGRAYKNPPKDNTRIHHDIYGAGSVIGYDRSSGQIGIRFDAHGIKILVWKFVTINQRIRTLVKAKP
jgi:hypothetical protein